MSHSVVVALHDSFRALVALAVRLIRLFCLACDVHASFSALHLWVLDWSGVTVTLFDFLVDCFSRGYLLVSLGRSFVRTSF